MEFLTAILEKSASLGWVIGIFISFLVIFHVLLVWLFPLTPRGWKRVEYIWVSMAFVSALGLVDEARRYRAETQFNQVALQTQQSLQRINNWVENYYEFSCLEKTKDQQLCQLINGFKHSIAIVTDLDSNTPDIVVGMLKELQETESLLKTPEKQHIHQLVQAYEQQRGRYLAIDQERTPSTVKMWLIILAPVFFAAALALKMTTISGELRCMKHK